MPERRIIYVGYNKVESSTYDPKVTSQFHSKQHFRLLIVDCIDKLAASRAQSERIIFLFFASRHEQINFTHRMRVYTALENILDTKQGNEDDRPGRSEKYGNGKSFSYFLPGKSDTFTNINFVSENTGGHYIAKLR